MSGLTFQDNAHFIAKRGDNYINFQAARQDSSTPKGYAAWLAVDGSYIIQEMDRTDTADITLKYFYATAETQAFAAAWADRANKAYVEYNAIFG